MTLITEMRLLGRFLTEVVHRSEDGFVQIRYGPTVDKPRVWHVTTRSSGHDSTAIGDTLVVTLLKAATALATTSLAMLVWA